MPEDWQQGGFGLYVHWPFCQAKCPYCDLNSHVSSKINQKQWLESYLKELSRVAADTPDRILNSVFFGGGTPSLMEPDLVAAVIDEAKSHWRASNDIEITLEANPGSVEAGRFAGYRDAGVNRVSMGIQALNDADLKRLGRLHTVAEARAALDIARTCFDRVSFDLICARQDQSVADWRNELSEAMAMAVDHLSLYQLTIEPGTAFGERHKIGKLRGLPDEDRSADIYLATQEICEAHGMPAYEVSNHARVGAESRHNLIYWRCGDYAGIGPGAHGRLTIGGQRFATESEMNPGRWLAQSLNGSAETSRTKLTAQDHAEEYLMMGLRITEGIDIKRYNSISVQSLDPYRLSELQELGLIIETPGALAVTPQGRMVLNQVIAKLLVP